MNEVGFQLYEIVLKMKLIIRFNEIELVMV